MSVAPSEEAYLVEQCRQGCGEAFTPLVTRYQNAAYATALGYLRDAQDAQDAVQDAFVAAYCKLGQLRDPARFGGWLRQIVDNRCREFLRQRRKVQMQSLEAAEAGLAHQARSRHAEEGRKRELWDSVDRLPDHYRTVVLLHYLSGLSYEEMAAFLEVPISTVRGRLQQSRIRLREALSPDELEEIEMSKVDVSGEVEETVCQIATQPIDLSVDLRDTDNVVLFCGVHVDIEIEQAPGDDLLLKGTKASVGLTAETARQSAERIEIRADRVADAVEAGPHEGRVFTHTSTDKQGKPIGGSAPFADLWRDDIENQSSSLSGLKPVDLFPFLRESAPLFVQDLRPALKDAARISILRPEMEDIVLPWPAFTEDVRKVFSPNNTSDESVHGPIGRVNLALALPAGKTLTIYKGKSVRIKDVRASFNLIRCSAREISQVEGHIHLLDTPLEEARHIAGKIHQRFHSYVGASWDDGIVRRSASLSSHLEDICGEVDLDVGRVAIEAKDLSGCIRILNRHGTTRLAQARFRAGDRYWLQSNSGALTLALQENIPSTASLVCLTMCGTIDRTSLQDIADRNANDGQVILVSTDARLGDEKGLQNADFYLQSESGPIALEKFA